MKFIRITNETAVNVNSIDRISRNIDGFGVIHMGMEEFLSSFPYDSLISLLSIDTEERGEGPMPTATALTY